MPSAARLVWEVGSEFLVMRPETDPGEELEDFERTSELVCSSEGFAVHHPELLVRIRAETGNGWQSQSGADRSERRAWKCRISQLCTRSKARAGHGGEMTHISLGSRDGEVAR